MRTLNEVLVSLHVEEHSGDRSMIDTKHDSRDNERESAMKTKEKPTTHKKHHNRYVCVSITDHEIFYMKLSARIRSVTNAVLAKELFIFTCLVVLRIYVS